MKKSKTYLIISRLITIAITLLLAFTSIGTNNRILAQEDENVVEETNEVVEQQEETSEEQQEEIVEQQEETVEQQEETVEEQQEIIPEEEIENQEETDPEEVVEKQEENNEQQSDEQQTIYSAGQLNFAQADYEISISYDESAMIPEGAKLSVKEIVEDSNKYSEYLENAASAVFENEDIEADTLPYARFFDITILSKDDEVIEPQSNVNVVIDLKDDVLNTEDVEFSAVHFVEEEDEIVETSLVEVETEEVVTFEAESFSVYGVIYFYTVDFYYQGSEYHMNGGSEILLSDLLNKLAIEINLSDIESVSFSDSELISVNKTDEDYLLKSLKPFTSFETLTITLKNGEVIVINVEDEIASGVFGENNSLEWFIDDNGHFTLKPVNGTSGRIDKQYSSPTSKNGSTLRDTGCQPWPWEEYKDQILTAEIKGTIGSFGDRKYIGMFEWCSNLTSVDVSGLDMTRVVNVQWFFGNCPKLETITGLDTWNTEGSTTLSGAPGFKYIDSMFRNSSSLTEIDLSSWTNRGSLEQMQNLCNGCSSLKSFILNNENFVTKYDCLVENKNSDNGVFYGCTSLEYVDLSNITIKASKDYNQTPSSNQQSLKGLFENLPALQEVKMVNTDLSKVRNMDDMFANCPNLKTITFNPKGKLEMIKNMDNFVSGCTNLETLDLTGTDNANATDHHELGLATLTNLVTLIADDTKIYANKNGVSIGNTADVVVERDIDIMPGAEFKFTPKGTYTKTSTIHGTHNVGDPYTGDETDVTTTGVIQLIANDSRASGNNMNYVYPNPHGNNYLAPGTYVNKNPGKTNPDVPLTYYIIDSMSDKDPLVEFYVDDDWYEYSDISRAADRTGYLVNTNTSAGSSNTRIFTREMDNSQWYNSDTGNYDNVNDRYNYDQGVPIRITYPQAATGVNGEKRDVVITINKITFEDMSRVPNCTDEKYKNLTGPGEDEYEIIDNPWGPDSSRPDKEKIPGGEDGDRSYSRYLMNADTGELRFWNQIVKSGATSEYDLTGYYLYSKGSGTYIDFTLSIKDAEENQSVLYWCDDLDMPENEYWQMPTSNPNDDVKTGENYGPGGEGMALGSGNDLDSITITESSFLNIENYPGYGEGEGNYLVGSQPDGATSNSRFYVKGQATGTNYKWTTGTSCETSILKSTSFKRPKNLDINIVLEGIKTINGHVPAEKYNRIFDFVLEPYDGIDVVDYEGEDIPNKAGIAYPNPKVSGDEQETVKNELGDITFNEITFLAPGYNFLLLEGQKDPLFNSYDVYLDSDNIKFYYDTRQEKTYTWTEEKTGSGDDEEITYHVEEYVPCTDTIKAYVFKISEKEGDEHSITKYDDPEYYVEAVVVSPQTDADLENGTKLLLTLGKKTSEDSDIVWDYDNTTIVYGKDTSKEEPFKYDTPPFEFDNLSSEAELDAGTINVRKILNGRSWKHNDLFRMSLIPTNSNYPMPDGYSTLDSGIKHADVTITREDTLIDHKTYEDSEGFGAITFSGADLAGENQKTFTYHIREITPAEGGDERISGITYSTERYEVDITVKNVDGNISIDDVKIYVVTEDDAGDDEKGDEVEFATFTNSYDAEKTVYKMNAEKEFVSYDDEKTLKNHDYSFILKPVGEYAKIAPMPKNTVGEGADRTLTVFNLDEEIHFEDINDSEDGLTFRYNDEGEEKGLVTLLLPYFDNDESKVYEALHGEGVAFEYEMYEVIPDGAINNDDGTYSLDDSIAKATTIYDGIHHVRMIVVRVVDDELERYEDDDNEELSVEIDTTSYDLYIDNDDVVYYYEDNDTEGDAYKFEQLITFTPNLTPGNPDTAVDEHGQPIIKEVELHSYQVYVDANNVYYYQDITGDHRRVIDDSEYAPNPPVIDIYWNKDYKVYRDGNDTDFYFDDQGVARLTIGDSEYTPVDPYVYIYGPGHYKRFYEYLSVYVDYNGVEFYYNLQGQPKKYADDTDYTPQLIYKKTGEITTIDGTTYNIYVDRDNIEYIYEENTDDNYAHKIEFSTLYTPNLHSLKVEGHADDHNDDYYIKTDGSKVTFVDGLDGHYTHHTGPDGVPVFCNEYIPHGASIIVRKQWKDYSDDKRSNLEFVLYRQGPEDVEPVEVTEDMEGESITPEYLTTKQDGTVSWSNLPILEKGEFIKYSVVEKGADEAYVVIIEEEDVTLKEDIPSIINVKNVAAKEKVEKTIDRTIHYVTNKGETVYEDYVDSLTFTAVSRPKMIDGEPVFDDKGNPIFEWFDEEGTLLGEDTGDGSSVDWSKSGVEKEFDDVTSKEKDRYTYDIPVVKGQKVSPSDEDIEKTVVYTPDDYKIHFDPNGGSGDMPDQDMTWDEEDDLDPNTFTRKGYKFKGWNTKPDGSGDSYDDNQDVINFVDDEGNEITLYAQWEPYSYKIKYDPNGGKGNMDPQNFTYEDTSAITKENEFTKDGYDFVEFEAYTKDGVYIGKIKQPTDLIEYLKQQGDGGEIILYAQWKKRVTPYVPPKTGVE